MNHNRPERLALRQMARTATKPHKTKDLGGGFAKKLYERGLRAVMFGLYEAGKSCREGLEIRTPSAALHYPSRKRTRSQLIG